MLHYLTPLGQTGKIHVYDSGPVHRAAQKHCSKNAESLTESERIYVAINNSRLIHYLCSLFYSTLTEERYMMERKGSGKEKRIILVDPNQLLRTTLLRFLGRDIL
jgi:hypothetical protein